MINFCPNCHSIVNDGATFCAKCGVNILDFNESKESTQNSQQNRSERFEVNIVDEQEQPQADYTQSETISSNNDRGRKPKLNRYPFSVLAVFCIIGGSFTVIYGIFGAKLEITSVFSIVSGNFFIVLGVILTKVEAILNGDIILKKPKK